jgi:MFS family permease
MGDGLGLVRGSRVLRAIFVSSGLFVLGSGIASVSLVVFVREVMGGTALTMGWMAMAQASGGFLGSLLITRVSRRMRPVYLMAVPLLIAGVTVLVWVNRPTLLLVLPLLAIMGVFIVGFGVTSQTLLQGQTADQFRGRVAGALATTNALMLLVGMLIATTLGDRLGVVWLLDGTGILSLLAGMAALFTLRAEGRGVREQAAVEAAALGVAGQDP